MKEKKKRLPTLDGVQEMLGRIPKTWILAFAAACVFFLIFHGGFFDDRMLNEDFRHLIEVNRQRYGLGRFIHFHLTNDYCNSWAAGCAACLYVAMMTVLTVDLLRIRSKLCVVLTAALLVGMPAWSYMFSFLYSAVVYGRGYFLVVLAVWVADRRRWGFLPGIFILGISLGVLQSAVVPASVLCVLVLLRDILFSEELSYKAVLKKTLRFLIMGVAGVVFYLLLWRVLRELHHEAVATYRGMDRLGQFDLGQIAAKVKRCYTDVWSFFFGDRFFYMSKVQRVAYAILLAVSAFGSIYAVVRKPLRIIGLAVGIILLPLCLGCIAILVPAMETDTHLIYSIVFCIAFSVRLAESSMPDNWLGRANTWLLMLALCATLFSYMDVTSAYYVKVETYHEQTAAYENRLLSRIESTPGYTPDMPVAIHWDNTNEYRGLSSDVFTHVINDRDLWYSYVGSYTNAMKKTLDLIKAYTGVSLKSATTAQVQQTRYSPAFGELTAYPLEGSIAVIDGVLCVNCIYREVCVMQADDCTLLLDFIDHVPSEEDGSYAWYVYRDGEKDESLSRGYRKAPEHLITLTRDGRYTFKCYAKKGDGAKTANSYAVTVENGVIAADARLRQISMEEAQRRALPPLQAAAELTGDLCIRLTALNNAAGDGSDYSYAWRVYREGEHLAEYDRPFAAEAQYDLMLAEEGRYRFELIYRRGDEGTGISALSEEITVVRELDILRTGENEILLDYAGPAEDGEVTYAWYVYRDGERIKALDRNYQSSAAYSVSLEENGTYTFKCFVNAGGEKRSIMSFPVTVENGAILDDPRLEEITPEEARERSRPEIEIAVTSAGDRAVHLTVIDNSPGAGTEYTYAWYVFRNGERLKEYDRGYSPDPEYDLILAEPGEYRFKLFYRTGDSKKTVMSEAVVLGGAQENENAA